MHKDGRLEVSLVGLFDWFVGLVDLGFRVSRFEVSWLLKGMKVGIERALHITGAIRCITRVGKEGETRSSMLKASCSTAMRVEMLLLVFSMLGSDQ